MAGQENLADKLGIENFLVLVGDLAILAVKTFRRIFSRSLEVREIINQIYYLGFKSLSIANLTAIFTGMVLALQFGHAMARFGATSFVGQVVAVSILRELGPVLSGLMVGGRIGAGMAAELGSMKVTEQIDAIRALGGDPISKLIVPRVVAATLIMPILVTVADIVGILGGMLISNMEFGITPLYYYQSVLEIVVPGDYFSGVAKATVFGFFLALIACHQGFSTEGGTQGVGQATTRTVVITSVNTLIADLVLTKLFLAF